ncbi:hypothetical protein [Pseudomonas alkylphenolica]|uniref:hypothetical protein n=1 Tax=Pseudomonas alkylphenolica TaxID=237609 RepID=UPI0018D7D0D8|nr:hypothetical protein [Pseudomonas alkylphenolica]MBH3427786.1 hypothetical protein [Pseudomonas alkylphenolica]
MNAERFVEADAHVGETFEGFSLTELEQEPCQKTKPRKYGASKGLPLAAMPEKRQRISAAASKVAKKSGKSEAVSGKESTPRSACNLPLSAGSLPLIWPDR